MEQVLMERCEMDIWKVNEFNLLNEEAEEFTRRLFIYFHFIYSWLKNPRLHTQKSLYSLYKILWSQNLVNVKSPSHFK